MRAALSIVLAFIMVAALILSAYVVYRWKFYLEDTGVRLSFRTFRKFYDIAPEKYHYYYGYIRYQIDRYQEQNISMKTPIDHVKYVLWRRKIERRKATAESVKVTQKYIDCVRKDIENLTGGDTESNS